ncbi:MAG: GyrI-like domain-containing protein [Bryobacteraceae bacterium]
MAQVTLETVSSMLLAAVRRSVRIGEVGAAFGEALGVVWPFLRSQPGLHEGGHNVFLYHHPERRGLPMAVDFGVQVTRPFEEAGEVRAVLTPAGSAAVAVHRGPYGRTIETHDAIHAWARANSRRFVGQSWEVYGDWQDDETKLETTIFYLVD